MEVNQEKSCRGVLPIPPISSRWQVMDSGARSSLQFGQEMGVVKMEQRNRGALLALPQVFTQSSVPQRQELPSLFS